MQEEEESNQKGDAPAAPSENTIELEDQKTNEDQKDEEAEGKRPETATKG